LGLSMADKLKKVLNGVLTRVFGTKADRDLRSLLPIIGRINAEYAQLASLSEDELKGKTAEFRRRLAEGEPLDDLVPEAFAVVKEACRRNVGRKWKIVGHEITWDMVPYDVQLVGALALHQGKIAEMATGEGKTLVAVMPLYLNALPAKGCHLVTVNDYLARRDSEWMGEILRYLGLTVGVIQHDMTPPQRREAYNCDVTYGTNNEFGFDYLRDNMAVRKEDQVQRGHAYVIVDEVDSVLVDEARTPLIISGPVRSSHQRYDDLRGPVENLLRAQSRLVGEFINEATRLLEEADAEGIDERTARDKTYQAGTRLLQVQRAAPKNKRFMKLVADRNLKSLLHQVETDHMRDKRLHELDDDLYFSIDEREHSTNLSDQGRTLLSPGDPNYFVLPDLAEEMGRIERDESLEARQKIEEKQKVHLAYAQKSDELHTINQLLRAFSLYEKDVEYVVQDGKVMIVDEFTGRLMPGRRFSDGLHQALEAKERVTVEGETQTWATITLQNYFRLYSKLAGMTGTAETEASEFWQIYKLDVVVIPTNEAIRRVDYDDVIFRTRREKYNAIVEEIARLHEAQLPILVGTVTVEVSETISRMLKRKGINHAVLNAKFHEQEAGIVTMAGRPGAVTIATNMAGRGTDIKLGAGVVKGRKCLIRSGAGVGDCQFPDDVRTCLKEVPCGLQIIGTERHESRRIDRQLRGRSGRQGDPGASRFFLSLEDDLMRLFAPERIGAMMDRLGMKEGEVIEHPMVTGAIERAQKRVEAHNFDIRKHLLEYDNVMNQQREVIYGIRNQILEGEDLSEQIGGLIEDVVQAKLEPVAELFTKRMKGELGEVDQRALQDAVEDLERIFLAPFPLGASRSGAAGKSGEAGTQGSGDAKAEHGAGADVVSTAIAIARAAHQARELEWGAPITRQVERHIYLRVIDDLWKDHLYEVDMLRSGIGLRAYGQKDPLLEYKAEAFGLFERLMTQMAEDMLRTFFRVQVQRDAPPPPPPPPSFARGQAIHQSPAGMAGAAPVSGSGPAGPPVPAGAVQGVTGQWQPAPMQRGAADAPAGMSAPAGRHPQGAPPSGRVHTVVRQEPKVGRNDPCPCGSGKKYKQCHGRGA